MYQLTKKKRSPILKFLGFLLVISITAEVLKVIFERPSTNEQIIQIAAEINKHCPKMVDSLTRLDNTIATSDNKLHFNYTFITMDIADIDTLVLKNSMTSSFTNKVKTDPKFKDFKKNDISISATFYDNSGHYVCNIFVDPRQF